MIVLLCYQGGGKGGGGGGGVRTGVTALWFQMETLATKKIT